jgi:DNA polymerase lambda
LKYYDELREKIPRQEVAEFESALRSELHQIDPQLEVTVCGSYRRGKVTCGDIDALVTHPDPKWKYDPTRGKAAAAAAGSAAGSTVRELLSSGGEGTSNAALLLEELLRRLHARGILTDDLVLPGHSHQRWQKKNIYTSEFDNEMYCGIGYLTPRTLPDGNVLGGKHRRIDIKVFNSRKPRTGHRQLNSDTLLLCSCLPYQVYHISEYPFALLYFTGSGEFGREIRLYANTKLQLSLSDKALTPYLKHGKEKVQSGVAIPCKSEEEIFAQLKLPYIPPPNRESFPANVQ